MIATLLSDPVDTSRWESFDWILSCSSGIRAPALPASMEVQTATAKEGPWVSIVHQHAYRTGASQGTCGDQRGLVRVYFTRAGHSNVTVTFRLVPRMP